jgi:hypothetical protein
VEPNQITKIRGKELNSTLSKEGRTNHQIQGKELNTTLSKEARTNHQIQSKN